MTQGVEKYKPNTSPLPAQVLMTFANFSEAQLDAAIAEATPRTQKLLKAKSDGRNLFRLD